MSSVVTITTTINIINGITLWDIDIGRAIGELTVKETSSPYWVCGLLTILAPPDTASSLPDWRISLDVYAHSHSIIIPTKRIIFYEQYSSKLITLIVSAISSRHNGLINTIFPFRLYYRCPHLLRDSVPCCRLGGIWLVYIPLGIGNHTFSNRTFCSSFNDADEHYNLVYFTAKPATKSINKLNSWIFTNNT